MFNLAQESIASDLIRRGDVFPLVVVLSAMLVGLVIALVAITAGILKTRAREETKREIAAYVAEGSIGAETAIAILQAEGKAQAGGCGSKRQRAAAGFGQQQVMVS